MSASIRRSEQVDVTTVADLRLNDTMRDLCDVTQTDADSSLMSDMDCCNLSNYVQNVVVYIAGFVVCSLRKRLVCSECVAVLTCTSSSSTSNQNDCGLIKTKNREGLLQPSDDVIKLCKLSESHFRSVMAPGQQPVLASSLKQILINSVLRSCIGQQVFEDLIEHTSDSDPVDDHRVLLMKLVVDQYLVCRLHHHHQAVFFASHTHPQQTLKINKNCIVLRTVNNVPVSVLKHFYTDL